MADCMLRLVLALLVVLQPMLVAQCAAMSATPQCAPPCGDMGHSQSSQTPAPCCKLAPEKSDPQAVKTATVELRVNDDQAVMVAAPASATRPQIRSLSRGETIPTDLRHKRPLSEVLCVLLV